MLPAAYETYSLEPESIPESALYAIYTSIMLSEKGFMIAALSPADSAIAKKTVFIFSRSGRPKDMFETPRLVLPPILQIAATVASVVFAADGSELTARARGSIIISLRLIPYFSASEYILSAISTRPSTVSGIPFSSSVSPMRTPPYLAAKGNIESRLSLLPFTEFISGFPLYILSARSIASLSEVSIWSGVSHIS